MKSYGVVAIAIGGPCLEYWYLCECCYDDCRFARCYFFVVFFSFPWSGHTENDGGLPRGGADVGSYPRGRLLIKI